MGTPFISELKIISFNFAPQGWALANGQLLPIAQNQALFSLLGTTYGGDGRVNFALPDLRGRVPIHQGAGFTLGQRGGEPQHTVTISELPTHIHFLNATTAAANMAVPGTNLLGAGAATDPLYSAATNLTAMGPASVTNTGGSQAHLNMQPFLCLNIIIALIGVFPSQN